MAGAFRFPGLAKVRTLPALVAERASDIDRGVPVDEELGRGLNALERLRGTIIAVKLAAWGASR
jgi:hypothetical protein